MSELETVTSVTPQDSLTLTLFTPRAGLERLYGPIHTITEYEAAMEDSFGTWVEGVPMKLRSERLGESGSPLQRDRYGANGAMLDHAVYTYDGDGNLVERTHYDGDGNAYLRYAYALDNQGRLAEMTGLDEAGAERSRLHRHYADNGRLAGLVEWRDGENGTAPEESRWRIGLAKDGSVTHAEGETVRDDGDLVERMICRYDRSGNVSDTVRIAPDGEWIEKTRLLFGPQKERGNWVRRVTEHCVRRFGQEQYQPVNVTYRRFTFFPG
jgi:hypothetical protein